MSPTSAPSGQLGPRSLLVRVASDWRAMIPGSAAGIMQLMHPGIGLGVAEHSAFFDAPFDRIYRSIPQIWATLLRPDGEQRAMAIRDLHAGIKGTDDQGRRYHALEPETFWWAHATFTWEMFRSVELFHRRRLSPRRREELYQDTVAWYRRYGMSLRPVPRNYSAFVEKFDDVCDHTLELTPAAERALSYSLADVPGEPLGGRLLQRTVAPMVGQPVAVLFLGCLPDRVRQRFDIGFGPLEQAEFHVLCGAVRQGFRFVPRRVNESTFTLLQRRIGARTRPQRFHPAA